MQSRDVTSRPITVAPHFTFRMPQFRILPIADEWLLRLNIDKCKAVSYSLKTPLDAQYHIIDGMSYNLEKLNSINDLGVIFDSNLTFKCPSDGPKINKAYSILGIIKRNFIYTWLSLVFATRAVLSAVLGVVILSVCPSVTRVLSD